MVDTLIVKGDLINPPTESWALGLVLLLARRYNGLYCVAEVPFDLRDAYYSYLRQKYLTDHIKALVFPLDNESGIRIDTELNFPLTVVVDRVNSKNALWLVAQIGILHSVANST